MTDSNNTPLISTMTWKDILESLTIDDVERFLYSLGVNYIRHEGADTLICPTICHNPIDEQGSMKLYWYQKNKTFHCYTECNENMSIFELYMKYCAINYGPITFMEAELYIKQFLSNIVFAPTAPTRKLSEGLLLKSSPEQRYVMELPEYSRSSLDCFVQHYYHPLWKKEGISDAAMDKFDIRFSISQNKIIIPHYDVDGRLIGIRGRALNEDELAAGCKYTPVKLGDKFYSHQLHFNLYGVWENKEAIKLMKTAVIFEGEKSVIKGYDAYGKYNNFVAACGFTINKYQINLLTYRLGVNNIVLAFDKEFERFGDADYHTYLKKMTDLCKKYKSQANISFIIDTKGLLNKKDSPIDKGVKVWEQLYENRIKV